MHHGKWQTMLASFGGDVRSLDLPGADGDVLPGVKWGAFDEFMTPAFWVGRAWVETDLASPERFKLGCTLEEEVAACLLGGFGIPAEVGIAAFERIRDSRLLSRLPTTEAIWALLARPLSVAGRSVRYRFARQKADYLARALRALSEQQLEDLEDLAFRDVLLALPGVGLKTASWITRNWRESDSVAILDVHICRACEAAGVFPLSSRPERDYRILEARFLEFACALRVKPSILDNIMWQTMRRMPVGSSGKPPTDTSSREEAGVLIS